MLSPSAATHTLKSGPSPPATETEDFSCGRDRACHSEVSLSGPFGKSVKTLGTKQTVAPQGSSRRQVLQVLSLRTDTVLPLHKWESWRGGSMRERSGAMAVFCILRSLDYISVYMCQNSKNIHLRSTNFLVRILHPEKKPKHALSSS